MGYYSRSNQKSLVSVASLAILSILSVGILYLWVRPSSSSGHASLLFSNINNITALSSSSSSGCPAVTHPRDELGLALERASSISNKTVVIVVINRAYVEPPRGTRETTTMLDNFLEGLWVGEGTRELVEMLLVVAVDQAAYERCVFLRLNCYKMDAGEADDREKLYLSAGFIHLMWRRTFLLLQVLKRGYSFIFTDADVVWLRNPFPSLLSKNKSETTEDFQISTDVYNGDPHSPDHLINTGFYYVRSNNKTIKMFESWYGRRDNSSKKEQDVLFEMSRAGVLTSDLGVKTRYLDTVRFSGFCSDSTDVGQVITVHANCCRSIIAKVKDLKAVIGDWKRWKMLVAHWKVTGRRRAVPFRWTGHFGCWNSWNNHNVTTHQ